MIEDGRYDEADKCSVPLTVSLRCDYTSQVPGYHLSLATTKHPQQLLSKI